MTVETPDSRVFDWLGTDSNGVGYYLHPLNLVWSDAGAEHDLRVFTKVATKLVEQPAYWSEIIRTSSWRHTLVGCVCVMLVRPTDRFNDLLFRFESGSFVSPQICVTMGIVYPQDTINRLNEFLDGPKNANHKYKQLIAAQSVLAKLGAPRSKPIPTHALGWLERDDAEIASNVVDSQWDFWSKHSGDSLRVA